MTEPGDEIPEIEPPTNAEELVERIREEISDE